MVSRDNREPSGSGKDDEADRLNVLFITADQHRFDAVGFMGNSEVKTPNLDRLAEGGVVFERAYVTNPVCMPSRATMITGQFPDTHGVRRNGIEVPDVPWGLARMFRNHGYRTGMFGKTHFCPLRRDYDKNAEFHDRDRGDTYYGFEDRAITHDLKDYVSDVDTTYHPHGADGNGELNFSRDDYLDWIQRDHPEYFRLAVREGLADRENPIAPELWTSELPTELHQSRWIANQTMEFINHRRDERWFGWCSFVDPHHPFNAPKEFRERYDADSFGPPVRRDGELDRRSHYHRSRSKQQRGVWAEHWDEYRAQYYAMITLIDDEVGRLIDHLETLGLRERTLVVFTADHGEMLGDHGLSRKGLFHYEPLIRVPLIVSQPNKLPDNRRVSGIVQTVDLPATMMDAAGIPIPFQYQGLSLLPWCVEDRQDSPRAFALITNGGEGPGYDPWPELRTLVTDRWKLQYYVGEAHMEIDDLQDDPLELHPCNPDDHHQLAISLLQSMIDATSAASVWRQHTGRW